MKFASMLSRLRNTQGGMGSTAKSVPTPYQPYTDPSPDEPAPFGVNAGEPQTVALGTTVNFSGSVSNPPDDVVLNYKWTFDDKAKPPAVSNGIKASYTYPTSGVKTATLTVSYTGTDGEVKVSDSVAITVVKLTLTAKPGTIMRGDNATYEAKVDPSVPNTTFKWKFTDAAGAGLPIPGDTGTTNTWTGTMAVGGTIQVTASVNNEDFTESLETIVQPRVWKDTFPKPPMAASTKNQGYGTLEQFPRRSEDLGHTVRPGTKNFKMPVAKADGALIISGPNKGWVYLKNPPLEREAWEMEVHVNPALTNRNHPFYRHNEFRNRIRGFPFYMQQLHESVSIHEGAILDPDRHYKSHMGEGHKQISDDPINPWAEDRVEYQNMKDPTQQHIAQNFINEIQGTLNTKLEKVRIKFEGHPTSKYFDPDPRRRRERIPTPDFRY